MKEVFLVLVFFLLFSPMVLGEEFVADEIEFFVSPDSSFEEVSSLIDRSNSSIYIATYSFGNLPLAKKIAKKDKVDRIIMVESSPVGGLNERAISLLSNKTEVYLNKNDQYHYHHAKYAIFDNETVLVSTENFGYNGMPPNNYGNRGWFATIKDKEVANYFLDLFFRDLQNSERYHGEYTKIKRDQKEGEYQPKFNKVRCYNSSVEIFVGPGVKEGVLRFLKSSEEKLWVEQFYIYKNWSYKRNPFLKKTIQKSKDLDIKVLMDSTWYVTQKDDSNSNYNTMKYLRSRNISSKLLNKEKTGLLKIHTKGAIEEDSILISSINWNEHSSTKNREIGLVVHCNNASEYFSQVFEYDWDPTIQTPSQDSNSLGYRMHQVLLYPVRLLSSFWERVF